jgi:hypothetical protein
LLQRTFIRSQGVTESNGGVCGYEKGFIPKQARYTNLSRYTAVYKDVTDPATGQVTEVQEVFIIGNPRFEKAEVHPDVKAEMQRLRQNCQVQLSNTP